MHTQTPGIDRAFFFWPLRKSWPVKVEARGNIQDHLHGYSLHFRVRNIDPGVSGRLRSCTHRAILLTFCCRDIGSICWMCAVLLFRLSRPTCLPSGILSEALRPRCTLKTLESADIERYLARRSRIITCQTLEHVISHLRTSLRYSFTADLLPRRLDEIDSPRTYRDEMPPRALPWAQVTALLRSVDRSSKASGAMRRLTSYYSQHPNHGGHADV